MQMNNNKEKATRERLLDTAEELAFHRGFDRTSVSDILTASKVGKGAFYHHFKNKESLGVAVLEREREEFMKMLDRCLNVGPTPLDGLDRFFVEALNKHKEKKFVGGCLWGNTALEMSDSNSVFTDFTAKVFDEWRKKLAANIQAGQQAGQIRGDCSPGELAYSAVAIVEGAIMQSRLRKDETPMKECLQLMMRLLVA